MSLLLDHLNAPQKEAVIHTHGPLLVLAGAGSGKTRVLTHRIAYLIEQGIPASQILGVTFTNKAASQMQSRIEKLLPSSPPLLGTFHSIGVRILRKNIHLLAQGHNQNFVIFDTDDTKGLLKIIMKEKSIDDQEIKIKPLQSAISAIKNLLITPEVFFEQNEFPSNKFTQAVIDIFPIYQQKLEQHNALDFDDLLQKTVNLFEKIPECLAYYQNLWQFVLVDEYQDTNFAQYRFIRLLTKKHKNLCVVGDDHQSIYSFRGADFRNILNFEKDFPETKVVLLEQNYRSSKNILQNANTLIAHNQTGKTKNLWTQAQEGEKVIIHETFDERSEAEFIAKQVFEASSQGLKYNQMAVLYRMNAQSRSIEEALMRNQIPYQIVGGVRFFDRKEIKDVIAYLRLIFNPQDDLAFLRIINTPVRKIGVSTLETLKQFSQENQTSLFQSIKNINETSLNETKKNTLKTFYQGINSLIEKSKEASLNTLIEALLDWSEFFKHLDDGTPEGQSRIQNVKELFSVAIKYEEAENSLGTFLEGVALTSDIDQWGNQDSLTLMTLHASKGLEFETVFLPGWETNIFPSASSQFSPESQEEERRLAYVGITRAKQKCFISHAQKRMLFGSRNFCNPSIFLSQLDENCIEKTSIISGNNFRKPVPNFNHPLLSPTPKTKNEAIFDIQENQTQYKIGDQINHKEMGKGTILQVAGDVLSITFRDHGIQKLVASIAPIEKTE